ncbi:MAG: T9SS type A sorting domain-containing protein [Cytophagaceae bacterium]|nr:T9SS type A sorting domain-containing protein [Cytophagaceae bacterium]
MLHTGISFSQICQTPQPELITNGSFELGTDGSFQSDYNYRPNACCLGIGDWTVTSNAQAIHATAYQNPTGGAYSGSNYMVIDADGVLNKDAWRTTVTVTSGKTYYFSAWISNINTWYDNPSQLRFSVNGTQIGGVITAPSNNHNWIQFYATWNSGVVSGPVVIRLENLITTGIGNDLALDDISFSGSCSSVTNPFNSSSKLKDTISICNGGGAIVLNPQLPGSISYAWKKKPDIVTVIGTGSTYSTSSIGTYYLCYDTIVGSPIGCPKLDSVVVINTKFSIDLGPDRNLCTPTSYTIDASVINPPVKVKWYKNSTLLTGDTSSTLSVTSAGTYRVDATLPGCPMGSDQVVFTTNTATPIDACFSSAPQSVTLGISGPGTYQWYANPTGGSPIASGTSYTTPPISSPTTYYVEDMTSQYYSVAQKTFYPTGYAVAQDPAKYLRFNTSQTVTIDSVTVGAYFYSTGETYNIGVGLYDNAGTLITTSTPVTVAGTTYYTGTNPVLIRIKVGITVPVGAGWRLSNTGTTGNGIHYSDNIASIPWSSTASTNPFRIPGIIDIYDGQAYWTTPSTTYPFFYDWKIHTGSPCNRVPVSAVYCPLPVELGDFTAYKINQGVQLQWHTFTEINSDKFIIEKSTDGIYFSSIGNIKADGNSKDKVFYSFIDYSSSSKESYYRLKQVDFDGKYSYSPLVKVSSENKEGILNIYPVPINQGEALHVDYALSEDDELLIKVMDVLGQEIVSYKNSYTKGTHHITIPMSFKAGIYYVVIHSLSKTNTEKILIK